MMMFELLYSLLIVQVAFQTLYFVFHSYFILFYFNNFTVASRIFITEMKVVSFPAQSFPHINIQLLSQVTAKA